MSSRDTVFENVLIQSRGCNAYLLTMEKVIVISSDSSESDKGADFEDDVVVAEKDFELREFNDVVGFADDKYEPQQSDDSFAAT